MYIVHAIDINIKGSNSSFCHKLASAIVFIYNFSIGLHQSIYATNINTQVMIEPSQYTEFIQYNNTILFSFTSNHITVFIHILKGHYTYNECRTLNSGFWILKLRCAPLGRLTLRWLIWLNFNLLLNLIRL